MIKTITDSFLFSLTLCLPLMGALFLLLSPQDASAAAASASLGGGNALSRALAGESQGLAHASLSSDLLSHLISASTRGGRGDEVPPANSNAGSNNEETDNDDTGEENNGTTSLPENANENGVSHANGGAVTGEGGNGGNSGEGGLVKAGSVVSSAFAVNVINVNIVRISTR